MCSLSQQEAPQGCCMTAQVLQGWTCHSVWVQEAGKEYWESCVPLTLAEMQHPLKLRHLSIDCDGWYDKHAYDQEEPLNSEPDDALSGLSALVNLEHLQLDCLPSFGVPGGLPSQLQKLTCLRVCYTTACDVAEQLQHLRALTALKEFRFRGVDCNHPLARTALAHKLSGVGSLPQLTSLGLDAPLHFSTSSTNGWACLTVLQSLRLAGCSVEPEALAAFTQLRALSLQSVRPCSGAPVAPLLNAVSKLTLLTQLDMGLSEAAREHPPAAAFTALTASTNLCSLRLSSSVMTMRVSSVVWLQGVLQDWVLLQPGWIYPHLRHIDLQCERLSGVVLSEQQLQVLCSCCPAVDSLAFVLEHKASAAAFLPLLQLSALTYLELQQQSRDAVSGTKAAAAAVGVAVQLTSLQHLVVWGRPGLTDPLLLQLTALKALDKLGLHAKDPTKQYFPPAADEPVLDIHNKVCSLSTTRIENPCRRLLHEARIHA
jgi:hypothetical protein